MTDTLKCPECGSEDVIVREVTSYLVNTHEFYCHSVKAHDGDAQCRCLKCDWECRRDQLKEQP